MGRRQLRDIKNKPHPGVTSAISSSMNRKPSHLASSTTAAWNDFSTDMQLNPNNSSLLIVNDFDDS